MLERTRDRLKAATTSELSVLRRMGQTAFGIQRAGWRLVTRGGSELPQVVKSLLEELGATYIKLGQFIASSPTLFPADYVAVCEDLLDKTQELDFSVIDKVLSAELGRDYARHFRSIDKKPLASASIAQVHAAQLLNGDAVVLKVQKPDVERIMSTDFQFLQLGVQLFERLALKRYHRSLSDIVDEIRRGMLDECDFRKEARNLDDYRSFLETSGITSVCVPRWYPALSGRRVLTMERFYGVSLADYDEVRKRCPEPETALLAALNTWFESLMRCRVYHADLHAGNVMILDDGRVGFIDFGIVGQISPETWSALLSLSGAAMARDFEQLAKALMTIGMTSQTVDVKAFSQDLRALYYGLMEAEDADPYELPPDEFLKGFSLQLSDLASRHGIRFPREFTLLLKQILYFDRYIKLLAPGLDLLNDPRVQLFS